MVGEIHSRGDSANATVQEQGQAASLANSLEFRAEGEEEFLPARFQTLRGRTLLIQVSSPPPEAGARLQVRNPNSSEGSKTLVATVASAERLDKSEAIVLELEMELDAGEVIAALLGRNPRPSDRPRGSGEPIFSGFDEDGAKKKRKRRRGSTNTPPSLAESEGSRSSTPEDTSEQAQRHGGGASSETSGELSWGWVARDHQELARKGSKATPIGDFDVEAIAAALSAAHEAISEDGPSVVSQMSELWSDQEHSEPRPSKTPPSLSRESRPSRDAGRYSAKSDAEVIQDIVSPSTDSSERRSRTPRPSRPPPQSGGGYLYHSEPPSGRGRKGSRERVKPRRKTRTSLHPERHTPAPIRQGASEHSALVDMDESPVAGIDLGTTTAKIALFDGQQVTLVGDPEATESPHTAMPALAAARRSQQLRIASAATRLFEYEDVVEIPSILRVLQHGGGSTGDDDLLRGVTFDYEFGPEGELFFENGGRVYTATDLASRLLRYLLSVASSQTKKEVSRAVITLPAGSDERLRATLGQAASRIGLEVLAFVSPPVAAAMGCGFSGERDSLVAVYDLGGGSVEASIIRVSDDRLSILGSASDRSINGRALDRVIAEQLALVYHEARGQVVAPNSVLWRRLDRTAAEAKRWLSTLDEVDLLLPFQTDNTTSETIVVTLPRVKLEDMFESMIVRSLECCNQACEAAGVKPADIEVLVLTGGMTRMPAVQAAVEQLFGCSASSCIYPEDAVAVGAALNAGMMSNLPIPDGLTQRLRGGKRAHPQIVLALSDGSTEPIIEATRSLPVTTHRLFCTSKDDQTVCRFQLVEEGIRADSGRHNLGVFIIDDLPERPAGETRLDVYFELDAAGNLRVTAQDRGSGQRATGLFQTGRPERS